MPRPKQLTPPYCHHRATDRAYVRIDGKFIYLGKHNTQASRDEYARVIGEWIGSGRPTAASKPADPSKGVTVAQVLKRLSAARGTPLS